MTPWPGVGVTQAYEAVLVWFRLYVHRYIRSTLESLRLQVESPVLGTSIASTFVYLVGWEPSNVSSVYHQGLKTPVKVCSESCPLAPVTLTKIYVREGLIHHRSSESRGPTSCPYPSSYPYPIFSKSTSPTHSARIFIEMIECRTNLKVQSYPALNNACRSVHVPAIHILMLTFSVLFWVLFIRLQLSHFPFPSSNPQTLNYFPLPTRGLLGLDYSY